MNDVLIIIPAYNEEKNIGGVINSLMGLHAPIDIVVIDDGSSDETSLKAKQSGGHVVSHPTNLGYACSILTGFRFAEKNNYLYVILFDGDGQHDPAYIIDMIHEITRDGVDVVIGSRFLMTSDMKVEFAKLTAVRFFRFVIYRITGKKITDPTSGFKAFKAKVFNKLTKSGNFYYDLPDSNFIVDILLQKLTISEIPVNMYDRKDGVSHIHKLGIKQVIYMAQTLLSILVIFIRYKLTR